MILIVSAISTYKQTITPCFPWWHQAVLWLACIKLLAFTWEMGSLTLLCSMSHLLGDFFSANCADWIIILGNEWFFFPNEIYFNAFGGREHCVHQKVTSLLILRFVCDFWWKRENYLWKMNKPSTFPLTCLSFGSKLSRKGWFSFRDWAWGGKVRELEARYTLTFLRQIL